MILVTESVRLSSHRLLLAACCAVCVLPGCGVSAPPAAELSDLETAYANEVAYAYEVARSVVLDVDEVIRQNIDHTLGGESTSLFMVAALEQAHKVLLECAATLRFSPPYAMDSLRSVNEKSAAVFEQAYVTCIEVVKNETGDVALSQAAAGLSELLGFPGAAGEGKSVTAAKARILACVGRAGNEVSNAATTGLGALNSLVAQIKTGRAAAADQATECFIATAAYGTESATQLQVLRDFRDEVLLASPEGRDYVAFYYAVSPDVARYIAEREWLRFVVREAVVDPIVAAISWTRGV